MCIALVTQPVRLEPFGSCVGRGPAAFARRTVGGAVELPSAVHEHIVAPSDTLFRHDTTLRRHVGGNTTNWRHLSARAPDDRHDVVTSVSAAA